MAEHATYFADDKSRKIFLAKKIISRFFVYLFLTIFALFLVAPFVLMVFGSFVEADAFYKFSSEGEFQWLGFSHWSFSNYKAAFSGTYTNVITGEEVQKTGTNFGVSFPYAAGASAIAASISITKSYSIFAPSARRGLGRESSLFGRSRIALFCTAVTFSQPGRDMISSSGVGP